ncbi:MAG: hypothetical protein ISP45_00080 [Reyranella sp.]|nr:hypothetical protein [Reyranella sp.]
MQPANHPSLTARAKHIFRTGTTMFVAVLTLFFAVHIANCKFRPPCHDDHLTARIARTVLGDTQALASRNSAHIDGAASGAGNGEFVALASIADSRALPSLLFKKSEGGRAFVAANARNTALAHRSVTVLLI